MTGQMTNLPDSKSVTVRSLRKPGHWWVDNEVLDMFGDDLGCYGIAVYAVLARLCYANSRVTVGMRELAAQARVSLTELARRLKIMTDLGLVVEHKGRTPKSRSSYDLMDVKDLVDQIKAAARERGTAVSSVPPRYRWEEGSAAGPQDAPHELSLANRPISSGDAPRGTEVDLEGIGELESSNLPSGRDSNCPSQVQMGAPESNEGKKTESAPQPGTDLYLGDVDLYLGGVNLYLGGDPIYRQYTRHKTKDKNPTLPSRGEGDQKNLSPPETPPEADPRWLAFIHELKSEMFDVPIGLESAKGWKQVQSGEHDWLACFSAWRLVEMQRGETGALFITEAENEPVTEAGIAKYEKRITRLLRRQFKLRKDEPVSFSLLRAEEQKPMPNGETKDKSRPNGEIPASDREAWEEVQRQAKEHLARLARGNPAIKLDWIAQGVEPTRLERVEAADGKRLWTLRSPAPATTRAVLDLLQEPVVRKIAAGVAILVLPADGEGP